MRQPDLSEYEAKISCKILGVKLNDELDYSGHKYKKLSYDIELLDDAIRYDYKNNRIAEHLPKETVLKDVSIVFNEI